MLLLLIINKEASFENLTINLHREVKHQSHYKVLRNLTIVHFKFALTYTPREKLVLNLVSP